MDSSSQNSENLASIADEKAYDVEMLQKLTIKYKGLYNSHHQSDLNVQNAFAVILTSLTNAKMWINKIIHNDI